MLSDTITKDHHFDYNYRSPRTPKPHNDIERKKRIAVGVGLFVLSILLMYDAMCLWSILQ